MAPVPPYPAEAAPTAAWQFGTGLPRWTPSACTGWTVSGGQGFRTLAALAGRVAVVPGSGMEELAAVSRLSTVRYWSTSDGGWRPLITGAAALAGPDPARRQADFSVSELLGGRDAYFVQHDSRSSGEVVCRMHVLDSGPGRLVVRSENVTPVCLPVVTLFQPGALQAAHFMRRLSPTGWGYYALLRAPALRARLCRALWLLAGSPAGLLVMRCDPAYLPAANRFANMEPTCGGAVGRHEVPGSGDRLSLTGRVVGRLLIQTALCDALGGCASHRAVPLMGTLGNINGTDMGRKGRIRQTPLASNHWMQP